MLSTMKILQKNLKRLTSYRKTLFWYLACLLFALTSSYVYLVHAAAIHGVHWEGAIEDSRSVSAVVSRREAAYLKEKRKITLSLAESLGFTDAVRVTFIGERRTGLVTRSNDL